MKLIYVCFLIFIFLKQFYIFESGGIQPSDLFLLLSFILIILSNSKKKEFNIKRVDYNLGIFTFFVCFINLIYYFNYNEGSFILSSLHYCFSFIVVIIFRYIGSNNYFLNKLVQVLKFNLILQLLIFVFGMGRYYSGIRYMGTFNDPNQMAFFIYVTLILLIFIEKILGRNTNILFYIISIYLIIVTSSTGVLIGFLSFIALYLLINCIKKRRILNRKIKVMKTYLVIVVSICFLYFLAQKWEVVSESILDLTIVQRVEEKIQKLQGTFYSERNNISLIEERGIDKLLLYPQKIIYGAGQGAYYRFIGSYSLHHEIHSTLPSIIFSYGIIPTGILIYWFYTNIRNIPLEIYAIFISLLLESFTLLNQRQPFFWMLFVLASLYKEKKN